MKLFNLDTVFHFGKHQGKTLKEIIEIDNKINLNGKEYNLIDEDLYIDWCARNLEIFVISKNTIEKIKKIKPSFYLSEEAIECLEEKYEEWLEERDSKYQIFNHFDYNDYYESDEGYCGACMESPCRCSDPGW